MNDLASKTPAKPPGGEGGTAPKPQKRKKSIVREEFRCRGRLPNGRRCHAAAIQHRSFCVFHDPEMQERRRRLSAPVPYEHPEEVQRLLGEMVDGVKKGKLQWKQANAVGYLATLLIQNQPRVKQEKEQMESLPYNTELSAGLREALLEHWKAQAEARAPREARSAEDSDTPERD